VPGNLERDGGEYRAYRWPVRRAVASIPPAAPLRESGAADSIERLFGAWKKPNPSNKKKLTGIYACEMTAHLMMLSAKDL
jgi:hypothetical protein